MKLSYNWLKKYVNVKISPEKIAEKLTMSGSEVKATREVGGDVLMDLEITSNRPDCLNIAGLAREVSAVLDKELKIPGGPIAKKDETKGPLGIKCVVKNKRFCPRYTARILGGVNVKGAGEEIKKYLLPLGFREVNNIVDITNYCLMELGQPLHAFDLDKIKGGEIIVREAFPGEKLVTIDGLERELSKGMLIIADSEKPIAIAGVMGGRETEVTERTKNVLLESAYFDPVSVRRTAHRLGISTDSSYRFERGVDKGMIKKASDRAAQLIVKSAGGVICGFYDVGGPIEKETTIDFSVMNAEKILGMELEARGVKKIFQRLGIEVVKAGKGKMKVRVPSFREDLSAEIDLVEEIARVSGYGKMPSRTNKIIPALVRKEHSRNVAEKVLKILAEEGLNQIMTYTLISEVAAKKFASGSESLVSLENPLSEEQKFMTPHLLDGMMKTISWNINRKNKDLGLFELGKAYSRASSDGTYLETPTLCVGMTGLLRKNWSEGERAVTFYDVKGALERLFDRLNVPVSFTNRDADDFTGAAAVTAGNPGEEIGVIGEVAANVAKEYGIEQKVYVCQVRMDSVISKAKLWKRYEAVPRFPLSVRDVSILCDKGLSAGEALNVIFGAGEATLKAAELIDVYEGEQLPEGKKSLSLSIKYGMDSRTLTEEEIERAHAWIKEALADKLKVTFR